MNKIIKLGLIIVLLVVGSYFAFDAFFSEDDVDNKLIIETGNEEIDDDNDEEENNSPNNVEEQVSDRDVYNNTKYGFSFKYPTSKTPFEGINQKQEFLIPASATSDVVMIAENEQRVFCCEPLLIRFEVVESNLAPREWLSNNRDRYLSEHDIVTQSEILIDGHPAIELIGREGLGSNYRLVAARTSEASHLLVIQQNAKTNFLNNIFGSIAFLKN